jgi:dipeptidyl aminopeptidase/acylaminoacyl peptidase
MFIQRLPAYTKCLGGSLIGILILLVVFSNGALARGLEPADVYRFHDVSNPAVSPDGHWVAYLVRHNDHGADESRTRLWMTDWRGQESVLLTDSLKDVSTPRWSPNGRYLAFLATPSGADKPQLLLLDRRGGEARVFTHVAGDLVDYVWAPDSKTVLLVMQGGNEAMASKVPLPIVIHARHFKQDEEGYLTDASLQHLYLLSLLDETVKPLFNAADANASSPAWSVDGSHVAFVRTRERGADADGMEDIVMVAVHGDSALRVLTRVYAPNHQKLAFTPDGKDLLLLQGLPPALTAYMADQLALVGVGGGAARPVIVALDRAITTYEVLPKSRTVEVLVEDDTRIYPARIALDTGRLERVFTGGQVITMMSMGADHRAVLASSDSSVPELYALEHGQLRRLTHHNDEWLAGISLGAVEDFNFQSRDGTDVHGFLVKPPGFVEGRRYPTILWIHGGPNGQDEHSLVVDTYPLQFERQMFAAAGYAVLAVNYRGSSGRGSAFQRAIAADWGHLEVEDLLSGVDAAVSRGIADPERLGIGGWSYGGILTDYVIATDGRFKAAISGAGSANQLSMYGHDEYVLQYTAELGPPWVNTALWLKLSYPFFHADRIRTPTLFMGGTRDFNVPLAGGEQMYEALRVLGVQTELVAYPDQYHLFTRPSYIEDRARRYLDWYRSYLTVSGASPQ